MGKVSVSVDLLNAVINYLAGQPYKDTFQLIAAIQKEANEQPKSSPLEDPVSE
jgi:hypothetical protein